MEEGKMKKRDGRLDGYNSKFRRISMEKRLERRKNVNRGYRKLRTWQMAIELIKVS